MAEGHARQSLVPELVSPIRLSIMIALAGVDAMDFPTLRDLIQLSDGTLSKQLSQLEQANMVSINKTFVGKRPKTWVEITSHGAEALRTHRHALERLLG